MNTTSSQCTTNHCYSRRHNTLPARPTAFNRLRLPFQELTAPSARTLPTTPNGFGTEPSLFARRYSRRRICFRFLPLLICLSPGSILAPRQTPVSARRDPTARLEASPFGHRGFRTPFVPLAYRTPLRPSSPSEPTDPPTGVPCSSQISNINLYYIYIYIIIFENIATNCLAAHS